MVAHKYAYASIDSYRDNFESLFVVAGVNGNKEKYREWLIKNKSKYDNVYFDITINGHLFENIERSQVRHHIQILDEAIGV